MKKTLFTFLIFTLFGGKVEAQCTTASQTITETFNAATFPACWTILSSCSHTFSRLYMNTYGAADARYVLPKAVNAKGILNFYAANTTNSQAGSGTITIGAVDSPSNWASFEAIATLVIAPTASGGYIIAIPYTVDLSSYTGTNQYIAISMPANPSRTLYFDNFNYESACISTTITAVAQDVTVQLSNTGIASLATTTVDNGSSSDCDDFTLSLSKTNFTCADIGTNTVTLTATNNQGVSSSATATVTVLPAITDETVSAASSTICTGGGTTIQTGSSVSGVKYYLRNDTNNSIVAGPITGTGSALTFQTGNLSTTKTYNVYAETALEQSYALDLDGTNDVVNSTFHYATTTAFTVETWMYPRSTNYDRVISSFSGAGAVLAGEFILDTYNDIHNGQGLRCVISGPNNVNFTVTVANVLTLNNWNHVAVTFNSGVLSLLVNGVQVATGTASFTSFPGSNYTMSFGEDRGLGVAEFFNGKLDEIRFWNTARSASEIQATMQSCLNGNESGLMAYYQFDEGSGTVALDAASTQNATLSNMTPSSDWITGQVNCFAGATPNCTFEMTQKATVSVGDILAPVPSLVSLPTVTAQCELTSLTAPTAIDNCAGTIVGTHTATLPITSNTTITWTYDDGNGNTSTQTQAIVINDVTAPVANVGSLTTLSSQCEITSLTAPTATDNCAGTITGTHTVSLPISSSTTITWTYDDGSGNTSTQTQAVVINDLVAPVVDMANLPALSAQCEIASLTTPTATDNCAGTITGTHNVSLPISSSTTLIWTFDDGNGNTTTQTQTVTIADNIAPVATLANLNTLTATCGLTSLTPPTATDNCSGTLTGTTSTSLPITASTTIVWTYDDGNGNTTTQNQVVVIANAAPVPDLVTLPTLTDQCAISSLSSPTATDFCEGTLTATHTISLPITASTTITWTFDDGHGNVVTQTQAVIINDITAPVADIATLPNLNEECEIAFLTAPTATDNCVGSVLGTHTINLPISSSTIITWTFDDGHGNTSTQTQEVVIQDMTAPVPTSVELSILNAICSINSLTAPTAMDNCSGVITATHSETLPITISKNITWTFDDGHGNTSTSLQSVVIDGINIGVSLNNETISADFTTADAYQWVDCDNSQAPISGATATTFTPTSNGNFAVEITVGSCTETSICTTVSTVGMPSIENETFVIYPNPVLDLLHVKTDVPVQSLTIFSMTGELLKQAEEASISTSSLAPGVYWIQLESDNVLLQRRFVKQ